MTYPESRYQGAGGAITAWFRLSDERPEITSANGTTVRYLATGASTDGLFGLYKWVMGPEPSRPGPHFHRTISESFFILSGTIRIYDGTGWRDTSVGDFVHVPPGGLHGFRNESGAPASMLIHFAPGAPREAYFEGLARLDEMSGPDRDAFFRFHDNLWVE